ncbi:hypothetical protein [Pseudoalteromonas denitrificans]|jgi:hypothetical protein|uniref:Motility protein n=1 Tax=Pseudoalteromonas denitrificans DSM 6059 TaxID=1123010 RepID=A0A1I1J9T8_9GAMM|nr:hypothetical protein [Pseudoalteromonas denitrificans]SFC45347.1 hypothetical protein SAMN02745724_01710 [Pseudoalteromonas denitrificans DSM 6059]
MDVSTGRLASVNNSEGAQLYSASLSKSQQKLEGQAALALIQATASTSQIVSSQPSASSVTATLGQNINIRV